MTQERHPTRRGKISTHWSASGGLSVSSRSWCSSSLLNKADSLFQPLVPAPCIWTPTKSAHTGSKVKAGKQLGGFSGSFEQWSSLIDSDANFFIDFKTFFFFFMILLNTRQDAEDGVQLILVRPHYNIFYGWLKYCFWNIKCPKDGVRAASTYFPCQLGYSIGPLLLLHWTHHIILHLCDLQQ